jgi:hypothetical protein
MHCCREVAAAAGWDVYGVTAAERTVIERIRERLGIGREDPVERDQD